MSNPSGSGPSERLTVFPLLSNNNAMNAAIYLRV